MNILEGLQKTASSVSKKTKYVFDTTKLEFKIKRHIKECNKVYNKIGRLVYECKKNNKPSNAEAIDSMCKEIDNLKGKIKNIEKHIEEIKSGEKNTEALGAVLFDSNENNYASFNRKENDLKILRTKEGIKFMKFCSNCNTGNEPYSQECIKCGHRFE